MNRRYFLSGMAVGAVAALTRFPIVSASFLQDANSLKGANGKAAAAKGIKKVIKTDEEWKRILTPEQYNVTRQKGLKHLSRVH